MLSAIIGLVGKPGSGKGTFPRIFRGACAKDGFHPSIGGPRFSDALRKTLDFFEVLPSRENLQELAKWLDARKPGAVANGMRRMLEEDRNEIKIADGVRWLYDENMIRNFDNDFLVYVKTDQKLRFERVKARKENAGDADKTWEQFLAEDQAQTERCIEDIGSRADFVINNDGALEDYERQVDEFYQKHIKPLRQKAE